MDQGEISKKDFNKGIDQFVAEAFKEEVQFVDQTNKQSKNRNNFNLTSILNTDSNNWDILLNDHKIESYKTRKEAEKAAEKINFIYNLGLMDGVAKGLYLNREEGVEAVDFQIVMQHFDEDEMMTD